MDTSSISKSEWTLTEDSFAKLLYRLAPDREVAGTEYEKLRRMLIKILEWRGATFPEDCADEALNRVAKKLASGEVIRDLVAYSHGIARLIFLETLRHPEHHNVSLDVLHNIVPAAVERDVGNKHRDCFDSCLRELPEASRQLILEYYRQEKRGKIDNRARLAETLGIPINALRSRALRVRQKLEGCAKDCRRH
jgi:DNA-directed RNA polymerase specialized sigma24 family protein